MQYFIIAVTLVLVCLGNTAVNAFIAGSRFISRNTFTSEAVESVQVRQSVKTHSKTCVCSTCMRKGITILQASSGSASADKGPKKLLKNCPLCKGKGASACVPCAGTGIDKINGNVFERWTCNKCKGFGQRSCPCTGEKGLTPEQRGER